MTRLRMLVTGGAGQLVLSLIERAPHHGVLVVSLGRPDIDLLHPGGIAAKVKALAPDIVVNAAGHTAVDQAESETEAVHVINAVAAGAVAEAAMAIGVAVVQISTDFVFDGRLDRPYREDDLPAPLNVYGKSKLDGEKLVAAANPNHAVVRTSWIYSPFGKNFVKTMLALGQTRSEISVVSDQVGSPTYAIDLADGILRVCHNLVESPDAADMRGIFHLTGSGTTNWAAFAFAILEEAAKRGSAHTRAVPIPSSAYPTPARRPRNSRLDNAKIARIHGVRLPCWRDGLTRCVTRLTS
jgi:dTDP-4-dehydrorhamnose reductase